MVFQDEATLIELLKKGQQKAVETWYEQSKGALEHFFVQRVAHESDAQELVHDTYLSVLTSLPLFRKESGLWSFMLSIARHELADYWRKRYAKRAIAMLPYGQELLETAEKPESTENLSSEVLTLLEKLPTELAELLMQKYVDGRSVKELAAQYGLSFAAMQSKLYRAKELFKEQYHRELVDEKTYE